MHGCYPLPIAFVFLWMDHRADAVADDMNATGHALLAAVGGTMSAREEMQQVHCLTNQIWAKWRADFREITQGGFNSLDFYLQHFLLASHSAKAPDN